MEGDINDRAYDPAGLNQALTILKSIKSLCVASIRKATNGECITLVNKVSENQSLINRLSGKENQMCRLLNYLGAKCFCATRAQLPKLFLHRL